MLQQTGSPQRPGQQAQANQQKAIESYEAALQVYTAEEYPIDWAMTQYNRGNAYASLRGEDERTELERALACFHVSLRMFNAMRMEYHAHVVGSALKRVQETLHGNKG